MAYDSTVVAKTIALPMEAKLTVKQGDEVKVADPVADWSHTNNIFYIDMSRLGLVLLFAFLCYLVYRATKLRQQNGRL